MSSVKVNVASLVEHAQKFSESSGSITAAFQRMHMEEIKKIEKEARNSGKIDEYLVSLRRQLSHTNRSVRERVAYLLGELMFLQPGSKEIGQTVRKLIEFTKDEMLFQPINTTGREIVNALGKSCKQEAELTLLQVLNNPKTKSIRQNILVALGKTGGTETVKVLDEMIKKSNISIPDRIHILWALGRLGSVQNVTRENFPLSRQLFERALASIFSIIQGGVTHPTIHYCAIYAVGEICDQRDTGMLQDSIQLTTLKKLRWLSLPLKSVVWRLAVLYKVTKSLSQSRNIIHRL